MKQEHVQLLNEIQEQYPTGMDQWGPGPEHPTAEESAQYMKAMTSQLDALIERFYDNDPAARDFVLAAIQHYQDCDQS